MTLAETMLNAAGCPGVLARWQPQAGGRSHLVHEVHACAGHLAPLGLLEPDGRIAVTETGRAVRERRLWLVGYGDWTGTASATLAGVTRAARTAAKEVQAALTDAPLVGA